MQTYYITTPIYYVNANPHLGHAYSTIVADAACRFHQMLGQKTLFLTGTDEHGDKIVQAAEKKQLSPREFTDGISANFRALWPKLSVEFSHFSRTTSEDHRQVVRDFLQKIYDAGDIYFGEFGGYYCYGCERFYTEKELENGLCPQHLTKPQFISEKNYFFRMSSYLPWLKEYLARNPEMVRPERYRAEAMAMLENGVLEDLCISRPKSRLTWGIELPFDSNYVCYVWFDALLCYIGGIGWPNGQEFWEFWPGEHLIAKDILKPHAIFWPCMLKAAGLPIYRHLNVHGYWLSRDTKMSKSLGNVVEPYATSQKYGVDAFRYFLLREMKFGSDANFSEEAITTRINADLANDLGNLFSRVLSMCAKYLDSLAPAVHTLLEEDKTLLNDGEEAILGYIQLFERMEFSSALELLWQFVRALNKYVDTQAPWQLFKNNETERLADVMGVLLAAMRRIAILLWPVMPDAAKAMLKQLGDKADAAPRLDRKDGDCGKFVFLEAGTKLAAASNLFPRIDSGKKKPDGEKGSKAKARDSGNNPAADTHTTAASESALPQIDINVFNSLDIRAGTILHAEKHPNADRILCLEIDFGEESPRQILSGLAEAYAPQELAGKRVCAILNLAPRKIRGLTSYGMVLTADDGKKLTLIEPAGEIANGARIG